MMDDDDDDDSAAFVTSCLLCNSGPLLSGCRLGGSATHPSSWSNFQGEI